MNLNLNTAVSGSSGGATSRLTFKGVETPLTISDRAQQMLNHLNNLDKECAVMREKMFGEAQSPDEDEDKAPNSLEGMLASACEQLASVVGEMAQINGRL